MRNVDVLILSSLLDLSTDKICNLLNKKNISFLRINRDNIKDIYLTLDPLTSCMTCQYDNETWYVEDDLRSVWWRNPTFLRNTLFSSRSFSKQLEISQWSAMLRGLMIYNRALWVNAPDATYKAESKPYQLKVAKQIGFHVPETIITNDSSSDVEKKIGDQIVLKSIDTILLRDKSYQYFAYTSIVEWEDCTSDNFNLFPSICQKIITPKLDLRVTVIGDMVWCNQVLYNNKEIEGDWRLHSKQYLSYPSFDLPIDVQKLCVLLVKSLGLVYGAIDLALSNDVFWFIEINPTGEWAWLDSPKSKIADTIVDHLALGGF